MNHPLRVKRASLFRASLLWLCSLVLFPLCLRAGLSPDDYARQLTDVAQDLRRAAGDSDADVRRTILADVRRRLPVSQTVENQGGTARPDHTWLYELLHESETGVQPDKSRAALRDAAERLEWTARGVKETKAAIASGDAARRGLEAVLQRKEFKGTERAENAGGINAQWQKMIDRLWNLLFGVRSRSGRLPVIEALFGLALMALVALLLSYIRSAWYRPPRIPGRPGEGSAALKAQGSPAELLEQARRYAEDGQYRWALRFVYLTLLVGLSERDWIRLDDRKTNREYVKEVRTKTADAAVAGRIARMTDRFECVWYGEQGCTVEQFQEYFDDFQAVQRTLGERTATA